MYLALHALADDPADVRLWLTAPWWGTQLGTDWQSEATAQRVSLHWSRTLSSKYIERFPKMPGVQADQFLHKLAFLHALMSPI